MQFRLKILSRWGQYCQKPSGMDGGSDASTLSVA